MWDWIARLSDLRERGQRFAIVTLVQCLGSTPRENGAKMFVLPDGKFYGTVGGGMLEQQLLAEAVTALIEDRNRFFKLPLCERSGQCCGGSVEAFVEIYRVPAQLYVFGAGHVGQAIARTLVGTPFQVTLVDEREDWISSEKIPQETRRFSGSWHDSIARAEWDPLRTYAVIMTHSHQEDRKILDTLLDRPLKYLGLIGSQTKWQRFKDGFKKEYGEETAIEKLEHVHCPIGLPIGGGKEPQTIAVSFAAEILKIFHEQTSHSEKTTTRSPIEKKLPIISSPGPQS